MSNVTAITPTPRTPMFSGAMIEHAAKTMRKAETNSTVPDADGLSQVCLCYLGSYLKANWDSEIRKPLTQEQWGALGFVAQSLMWIEDDLERDAEEVSIH